MTGKAYGRTEADLAATETASASTNQLERDVAFSGPALLINRTYVFLGPAGFRLAFAEQAAPNTSPIFRTAVAMSIQDGVILHKLLDKLLKRLASQTQEMAQSGKPFPN